MPKSNDFDITSNIKMIEKLKSELLTQVASLHKSMVNASFEEMSERLESLSNIIIISYILANRIGITHQNLDAKILSELKLSVINNDSALSAEYSLLYRHIEKKPIRP